MTRSVDAVIIGPSSRYSGGIVDYTRMLVEALSRITRITLLPITKIIPDRIYPGIINDGRESDAVDRSVHAPSFNLMAPSTWVAAASWISRVSPKILHMQCWTWVQAPAYLTLLYLLRLQNKRVDAILHFHTVAPHDQGLIHIILTKIMNLLLVRCATKVLVHTKVDRATIIAEASAPPSSTKVIPLPLYEQFAVDCHLTKKEAKKRLSVGKRLVILFFGIVRPYKGLDVLIDAMEILTNYHPNALLIIAGKFWTSELATRRRISARALQENVRIISRWIDDDEIPLLFLAADVAVFPYKSAAHSAALMTALSFSTQIVGTRVGGIAEALADYNRGILIPPNEPEALAEGLNRALKRINKCNDESNHKKHWLSWNDVAAMIVSFWEMKL